MTINGGIMNGNTLVKERIASLAKDLEAMDVNPVVIKTLTDMQESDFEFWVSDIAAFDLYDFLKVFLLDKLSFSSIKSAWELSGPVTTEDVQNIWVVSASAKEAFNMLVVYNGRVFVNRNHQHQTLAA
jgi:hypothetical protein